MTGRKSFVLLCIWICGTQFALPPAVGAGDDPVANAGPRDSTETPETGHPIDFPPYGARQLAFDTRHLVTRPGHWDRRAWIQVSSILGATFGLNLLREEIREVVRKNRGPGREDFLQDVRNMGKGAFAPGAALVAYLSSFATRKDREKETALLLLESWGYSALGAAAGQFVLATERPEDGDDIEFFQSNGHGVSLDTALAASVVPPLRRQYLRVKPDDRFALRFWKRAATGFLYAGAGLTAYQRMDQDKHWAPDVFLGMVTGLAVGNTLCDAHDSGRRPSLPRGRLEFTPAGVRWIFRFGNRRSPGIPREAPARTGVPAIPDPRSPFTRIHPSRR